MIELHGVHKRFGKQVMLDGVDFEVRDGETVALLGPSGTGKSVLLKHIIGLIQPGPRHRCSWTGCTSASSSGRSWPSCAPTSATSSRTARCSTR